MEKRLRLALNKYTPTPESLRDSPTSAAPIPTIGVALASLYHHYFLDKHGCMPPDPDPTRFEPVSFLAPSHEFRFAGDGYGASPAAKQHGSNELGQAFCRWFLHDHLGITYFAHMSSVLNRQVHRPFEGWSLERIAPGDTPDYLCADGAQHPFLAEAKGRYSSISFKTKEFSKWRQQFDRVVFKDTTGTPRFLKGHIVATRFATERDSPAVKSGLWAEDPASPGMIPFRNENGTPLGRTIAAMHYANICFKLRQPLLASALMSGVPLTQELQLRMPVWRVLAGPLEGRKFVGGYFGANGLAPTVRETQDGILMERPNPFQLDAPSSTFFGVEEQIFRQVVRLARSPEPVVRRTDSFTHSTEIDTFAQLTHFDSAFSVLRDGSVLAPLDYFSPLELVLY